MAIIVDPNRWREERKAARRRQIEMQGITNDVIYRILAEELPVDFLERRRKERAERKEQAALQRRLEEEFDKFTTRDLLAQMKAMRSRDHQDIEWWAIRKVLATRSHVWRGPKHRAWRARLAKKQHGQGKSKNR